MKFGVWFRTTFLQITVKSGRSNVFLEKGVLKICSKFTEEHSYQSVISKQLPCNFIEITLCHGCSPANVLHILRTPFTKNTSGCLLQNCEKVSLQIIINLNWSEEKDSCNMTIMLSQIQTKDFSYYSLRKAKW